MSLIVVEGVDGSGKSTLMENARLEITKRYFIQVRHSCRPLSIAHLNNLLSVVEHARDYVDVMLDRHPLISEPIYAGLLRPGTDLTIHADRWKTFEDRAVHLAHTVERIIYCRPSLEAVKRNVSVNPQLFGVVDKIDALYECYDRAMDAYGRFLPVVEYNYQIQDCQLVDLFFGK